jgi:2-hydroxy-3-keto-5-methylthiopentenyl-1-phosphate phosphatase
MNSLIGEYIALVSSDWSECLSPNGPFDPIAYSFPELNEDLKDIFKLYTGNAISLTEATTRIGSMLPHGIGPDQMDAYLNHSFQAYRGVIDLINWCLENHLLFMINSTGTKAYFQRSVGNSLIPDLPHIAANPLIDFREASHPSQFEYEVLETEDKAKCTALVAQKYGIPGERIIIIGDSGGDGPHFHWGATNGATLVGSMTKASLNQYCDSKDIEINMRIGPSYSLGESRDYEAEGSVDFMELKDYMASRLRI